MSYVLKDVVPSCLRIAESRMDEACLRLLPAFSITLSRPRGASSSIGNIEPSDTNSKTQPSLTY